MSSGGTQSVSSGGTASGTNVSSGGVQNISHGTVTSVTIGGNGIQNITAGGTAFHTTMEGGTQNIGSGGLAAYTTMTNGIQNITAGGTAIYTAMEGGTQNIESGGKASYTTMNGGTQNVHEGGESQHIEFHDGILNVDDNAEAQLDAATGGILRLLENGLATAVFGNIENAKAGTFALNTLYTRGDNVILGQGDASGSSPVGNVLQVGKLDGYANFVVNTDLANNKNDQVKIGHVENAIKANTIRINYDPTLAKENRVANVNALVATVDEANATVFTGTRSTIGGMDYLPTVESDDEGKNWYIRNVSVIGASEQSHHVLMGEEAAMAALAAGNKFIGDAMKGLSEEANTGADGVAVFAKVGGGTLRQETGSHVNVHTWNSILAMGHKNQKEQGTTEYGAFFEYGSGNYTAVNGAARGKGETRYTGGGLLAKWTARNGFYMEGSFRGGQSRNNAKDLLRDGAGNPYSYKANAAYFGGHIGLGKEIALKSGAKVDIYGKYFYNRKAGVRFAAGPDDYVLDDVTSHIMSLGVRYMMKRDKWDFYGEMAYEQEFGGRATGTVDGFSIREADTSGGSLFMELGAILRPTELSPWSLDLNLSGFAGKKRGLSGGIAAVYHF